MNDRSFEFLFVLILILAMIVGLHGSLTDHSSPEANGVCGAPGNEENVTWSLEKEQTTSGADGSVTYTLVFQGDGMMADLSDPPPWCEQTYQDSITGVVFSDGITNIGSNVCRGLAKLESVTIGRSVTVIGASAFGSCTSLTAISLPEGLQEIHEQAFEGCDALQYVTLSGASSPFIGRDAFPSDAPDLHFLAPCHWTDGDRIGTIPVTVRDHTWKDIDAPARRCTTCEATCTDHDWSANTGKCGLCSLIGGECGPSDDPGSVHWAFSGGTLYLTGSGAMASFDPKTAPVPWDDYKSVISSVAIDPDITDIGASAFRSHVSLTSITLPEGITSIGPRAFQGCLGLTEISLPTTLQSIGEGAFLSCIVLKQITLPESVVQLDASAFRDCIRLETVRLPEGITIRDDAFRNCTSLETLTYPGSLAPEIGTDAFAGCPGSLQMLVPCDWSWEDIGFPIQVDSSNHYYGDGEICTRCNRVADATVPTLTVLSSTLSFEKDLVYEVSYAAENIRDVVQMGLITFSGPLADGTIADATDLVRGNTRSGDLYTVRTDTVSPAELGDICYFKVYAKLSDGSYVYSDIASYCGVDYVKEILSSGTDAQQAHAVALLEYAAQACSYYGHDTSMDSFLTEEQKALISEYDDTMISDLTPVDPERSASIVYDGVSYTKRYASVIFDNTVSIGFYFTPATAIDGDMTLYYWDTDTYERVDVLDSGNATGSMTMVTTGTDGQYWGIVPDIPATAIDDTVFVAGVYELDGVEYWTGVLNYSVGRYCKSVTDKTDTPRSALAKALVTYCYYAQAALV